MAYGLEKREFRSSVSGYVAERRILRAAKEELTPEQFQDITGRKLRQVPGDRAKVAELMIREIEYKLIHKDSAKTIGIYKIVCKKGIIKAIKTLFNEKDLHSR